MGLRAQFTEEPPYSFLALVFLAFTTLYFGNALTHIPAYSNVGRRREQDMYQGMTSVVPSSLQAALNDKNSIRALALLLSPPVHTNSEIALNNAGQKFVASCVEIKR